MHVNFWSRENSTTFWFASIKILCYFKEDYGGS